MTGQFRTIVSTWALFSQQLLGLTLVSELFTHTATHRSAIPPPQHLRRPSHRVISSHQSGLIAHPRATPTNQPSSTPTRRTSSPLRGSTTPSPSPASPTPSSSSPSSPSSRPSTGSGGATSPAAVLLPCSWASCSSVSWASSSPTRRPTRSWCSSLAYTVGPPSDHKSFKGTGIEGSGRI